MTPLAKGRARAQAGRICDRMHAMGEHAYYVAQVHVDDGEVFYYAVRSWQEREAVWQRRCSRMLDRVLREQASR